jgi:FKBP-type peptidyl-prolyl cis-trans isomerase
MRKSFITLSLFAAELLLLGNALAQQTPATKPATAPAAKTSSATKPHTATAAKAPLVLSTQKAKLSYALGTNIGSGIKGQPIDIDPDILGRGIKDAMTGAKPLLTEEEVKTVLTQAQNELRQQQQAKMQAESAANKKQGEDFLAANKAKDGVVTLPSGLQYKILTAGTGPKPAATDSVVCNYRGTLVNGTEFDSSYKSGQPVTFAVNGVIKGWTEALQLMPVGSKWQLFVPADLAYGERARSAEIGPNSTLIFEVELLSIKDKTPAANAPGSGPSATGTPDGATTGTTRGATSGTATGATTGATTDDKK